MHICVFGLSATIVLRDEFLSWKVLRDAKTMGTAGIDHNLFTVYENKVELQQLRIGRCEGVSLQ